MPDIPIADPAPVPPVCPGDDECCRSGCSPCIFDLYAEELEQYRLALRAWEERQAGKAPSSHASSRRFAQGQPGLQE